MKLKMQNAKNCAAEKSRRRPLPDRCGQRVDQIIWNVRRQCLKQRRTAGGGQWSHVITCYPKNPHLSEKNHKERFYAYVLPSKRVANLFVTPSSGISFFANAWKINRACRVHSSKRLGFSRDFLAATFRRIQCFIACENTPSD